MTPKEAELKYGKETLKKMMKTGWLDVITITRRPNGEIDVPERDYEIAYRALRGERISPLEWD